MEQTDSIIKQIKLNISADEAFDNFINKFNEWWPKEYTWSQGTLKKILITPKVKGLCTEIGPNNFRVDWGTVTEIKENKMLSFKWQIGPNRDPIPNVEKASLVTVIFRSLSNSETEIQLKHSDFKNHGENYQDYLQALNSKEGWSFLLKCFENYVSK